MNLLWEWRESDEIQRREEAGPAAWRRVEGITWELGQKGEETTERKTCRQPVLYQRVCVCVGYTGTDRETKEVTGRKQVSKKNVE